MDNMTLIKRLPPMLSGDELEKALSILPEYDPNIVNENEAMRLISLSDLYKVFVPNQMSKEIYCKLYLALLRSLQKKESKLAVQQYAENHRAIKQQDYSGIIGGSDSFTIIGASGIGKSSSITRAIQLLTKEEVKALFPHDFKKGGLDLLEKAVAENLLDPAFLYVGTEAVNFDPAELIDFIVEHSDEEITVLYDVWPNKSQSVRIDGIAFKKDVSEKTIADLEIFRKKISKENKANKGRKYQTKEYIVCRWDKGAFVTKARDFHWA